MIIEWMIFPILIFLNLASRLVKQNNLTILDQVMSI